MYLGFRMLVSQTNNTDYVTCFPTFVDKYNEFIS